MRVGDAEERASTAIELGDLGDREAVPALIAALRADEDERVRNWAARSLGKLGDPTAIPALIEAIRLRHTALRAADALGDFGGLALDALLAAGDDEDHVVRAMVAFALRRIPAPRSIAALWRYLDDPDGVVRREAIRWLAGFQARQAIAPIVEKLTDPYREARDAAADALVLFAAEAPLDPALSAEITGTLLRLLIAKDPPRRESAAYALGVLRDALAFDPLVLGLADRNTSVRQSAAAALGTMGSDCAVGPLIGALADREPLVQAAAASALGELRAISSIPELVELLGEPNAGHAVRVATAGALSRMGHEALEPLIRLVNSGSPEMRYWGAVALGYLGISEALPALTACVARDDGQTADEVRARKAATKAIRHIEERDVNADKGE